jgi:hypothetical protein
VCALPLTIAPLLAVPARPLLAALCFVMGDDLFVVHIARRNARRSQPQHLPRAASFFAPPQHEAPGTA